MEAQPVMVACPPPPPPAAQHEEKVRATALHIAISKQRWEDCRTLLSGPDGNDLVQQKGRRNLTPLMLAARKGMPSDVVDVALALPGIMSVVACRQRHQTAADMFEDGGNLEAAEKVRALERQIADAPGNFRCPVCRDKVKKWSMLERLAAHVERGEETNPLVLDFFAHSEAVRTLSHTILHRVSDCPSIAKELSETMGIVRAMLCTVDGAKPHHIIDLCCGRGITAAFIGAAFSGWQVTAVDRVAEVALPHFAQGGLNNVRYLQLDLFSDGCLPAIRARTDAVGLPVVVLGMHCCGQLSLKAIDIYEQDPHARAIVLCPCCLPMSGKEQVDFLPASADAAAEDPYAAWADFLSARSAGTSDVVEDMLSEKNRVIRAAKAGRCGEE